MHPCLFLSLFFCYSFFIGEKQRNMLPYDERQRRYENIERITAPIAALYENQTPIADTGAQKNQQGKRRGAPRRQSEKLLAASVQILHGATHRERTEIVQATLVQAIAIGKRNEQDRLEFGRSNADEENALAEGIELHSIEESQNGQEYVRQDKADRRRCLWRGDARQKDRHESFVRDEDLEEG